MGLLRFSKFSKVPTFQQRFFQQKADKEKFSPTEQEFSSKQRDQFFGSVATAAVGVSTIQTMPEDSYGFLTNLHLSVGSSTIDFGDAGVYFGNTILNATRLIRMIPPIDSTGGKIAVATKVYNHPVRINPTDSIFLDNLVAQRANVDVFGFLLPKKEIDRELIDKYG